MATAEAVRERPILFSGEMVRAILDGRKTVTRRIVKPQPEVYQGQSGLQFEWPNWHGSQSAEGFARYCPYGQPGDRLWVRETWALVCPYHDFESGYIEDVDEWTGKVPSARPDRYQVWYAADSNDIDEHPDDRMVKRWRPSIFMPRWASRLTLRITSIRVERLHAITHEDALAEGCAGFNWVASSPYIVGPHTDDGELPVEEFAGRWDEINGKGAWDKNPWVWVLGFERVKPPKPASFEEAFSEAAK